MKHGKSEKDIRSLRQEIEILRSLQARSHAHACPAAGARSRKPHHAVHVRSTRTSST